MPREKKIQLTLKITMREAREMLLMLRLHAGHCEEHVRQSWQSWPDDERSTKARKSWVRSGRKADSLANHLSDAIICADNGDLRPAVLR